jgi:hypothetical protein
VYAYIWNNDENGNTVNVKLSEEIFHKCLVLFSSKTLIVPPSVLQYKDIHTGMCVCVCVRACVRACACVWVNSKDGCFV